MYVCVCVCVLNIQIVDETILFAQCTRKDIKVIQKCNNYNN